jgi:hypothetical protein
MFWDRFSRTICLGLALNCLPPDLCLLSSWNYRCESLCPVSLEFIYCFYFFGD